MIKVGDLVMIQVGKQQIPVSVLNVKQQGTRNFYDIQFTVNKVPRRFTVAETDILGEAYRWHNVYSIVCQKRHPTKEEVKRCPVIINTAPGIMKQKQADHNLFVRLDVDETTVDSMAEDRKLQRLVFAPQALEEARRFGLKDQADYGYTLEPDPTMVIKNEEFQKLLTAPQLNTVCHILSCENNVKAHCAHSSYRQDVVRCARHHAHEGDLSEEETI